MNALARIDLRDAYERAKALGDSEVDPRMTLMNVSELAGITLKLCHVCQALSEELEKKPDHEREISDLKLEVYNLQKALKTHTNTQDAHNF